MEEKKNEIDEIDNDNDNKDEEDEGSMKRLKVKK